MANQSTGGDGRIDRRRCCGSGGLWRQLGRRSCAEHMPKRHSDRKGLPTHRSSIPRSMPMRQTRRSDPGTVCQTGPRTLPATRWWRR